MIFRRRRPVRVQVANGIGFPFTEVELIPGEEVRFEIEMTQNICDRGFGSKDGKHRLKSHTYRIPVRIKLQENP